MVFTGAYTYLQWVREATFGTEATAIQSGGEQFGFEQKITGWSFTNNKIALSQLNDVRVKTYAYGQTRGSISLDFVLSSPWFLGLVGFKDAGTTGAGPYVHTWDLTTCAQKIDSFTTQVGQCQGGTDIVRTLTGGIVNSASISTSIGELARVTLDTNYKNESLTASLDSTPAGLCVSDHIPFTFAHGTLEFPDCTTIGEVQCVDITITQNADHIWGIGNSTAASAIRRLTEVTGKMKFSHVDKSQLIKLYAQQNNTLCNDSAGAQTLAAEQPTLTLKFDNGASSTDSRIIEFNLTGIALDDHNLSIEPNEPIFEEISFQARGATVVATNNTSTIPAAS